MFRFAWVIRFMGREVSNGLRQAGVVGTSDVGLNVLLFFILASTMTLK